VGGKGNNRDRGTRNPRRTPTTRPPDTPPDSLEVVTEKYSQLTAKYRALIEKFEDVSHQRFAVFQLGWWALRTSASGLALVRGDGIELCNDRWHELAHGEGGLRAWESADPGEGAHTVHASLQELALDESRRILQSNLSVTVRRYMRRGRDQALEVRTERFERERPFVTVLVHDITEQARAEAELRQAQDVLLRRDRLQTIGEVASGVAHDLNNALNVMRLRLALLGRDGIDERLRRGHLDAFARIVDDAAIRVARMHELAAKRGNDFESVDLALVIAEAVGLARTDLEHSEAADGRRFQLVIRTGESVTVIANSAELRHVFVNLLLNARDAMPEGGKISVECRREDGGTIVSVADEGTGIAPENLERIFESFFTTKGSRGTGLGLAMARGAMARIGGSIQARNLSPRGAELVLHFPLRDPAERSPPIATVPPPAPIRGTLRVLLVDDDVDCLDVTRDVLQAEALDVDVAHSGTEALALLGKHSYDLLLCDVGMPEMSGWQVAAEAKAARPALSIYMVTGWASEFTSADSRREAVDGVLAKPVDLDELRGVLGRIASARPVSRPADGSAQA
jgi:signal transduction histidine kinase/ActR/RegA family two-component response regulator